MSQWLLSLSIPGAMQVGRGCTAGRGCCSQWLEEARRWVTLPSPTYCRHTIQQLLPGISATVIRSHSLALKSVFPVPQTLVATVPPLIASSISAGSFLPTQSCSSRFPESLLPCVMFAFHVRWWSGWLASTWLGWPRPLKGPKK